VSDVKLGSWSVTGSPIVIEYTLVVIEEIRQAVIEGFQRLSRGGIEVGGVLYGARDGRTVRVLAMRPIECEHARGPSFALSDADQAALRAQLAQDERDPRLQGMICLGWFLSHTRTEINLSETDQQVYSTFFPAPWQVTLVVRPGRGGSMRGGFFVRETDGALKSEQSYLEFNFPERAASAVERLPSRERYADRRPSVLPLPEPVSVPAESTQYEVPGFAQPAPAASGPLFVPAPPPSRRKWPWLAAWLLLTIALVIFSIRYLVPQPAVEPINLAVSERDGQLQIEWNHLAKPVNLATSGSLEIVDGTERRTFSLTPQVLTRGNFVYLRNSADVQVRMTVDQPDGAKVEEASRFLGRAPAKQEQGGELDALKARRDELEAEVARLRRENGQQVQRIQQLDRTMRILQTRLGIDPDKK